jgi:hypothetical protein
MKLNTNAHIYTPQGSKKLLVVMIMETGIQAERKLSNT